MQQNVNTKRDNTIDICKAIGIISIVMGHSSWFVTLFGRQLQVGPFVYLYHLAIFFYCSGYLYKVEKPDQFIVKKVKGLYFPFVIYSVGYLLLRNVFIWWGIVSGKPYSLGEMIITFANTLCFNGNMELIGAFWFFPALFAALCIFEAIMIISEKLPKIMKWSMRIVGCLGFGILGVGVMLRGYGLLCSLNISFLMIPVIALGYLVKNCKRYFEKMDQLWIHLLVVALTFAVLCYILKLDIGIIELSKFMIINQYLFYPVTLVGIAFCVALAKTFGKNKVLSRCFGYIGKHSLDIMVWHFFSFKIVDTIACVIMHDFSQLGAFPYAYPNLWFVYYLAGICIPLLITLGIDWIKNMILLKVQENKK